MKSRKRETIYHCKYLVENFHGRKIHYSDIKSILKFMLNVHKIILK